MGKEHADLGPGQRFAGGAPLDHGGVAGKGLDAPVEKAAALELLHQAPLVVEILETAALRERNRQSLQIVVAEDQLADLVGHGGEETVATGEVYPARPHGAAERDLDVDLDVGGVDAGGIVD